MRNQAGFILMFVVALVSAASTASAGCPLMGGVKATCSSNSPSIESCVNAIWRDFSDISAFSRSLRKYPNDPAGRMSLINQTREALPGQIRLLAGASDYSFHDLTLSCDVTWDGIERCESDLRSARHGLEVLAKRELVTALPPGTRERLKQTLRQHETQISAQLDLIAASAKGEPSQLCNETYASVAGCKRAVAADQAAIRDQMFPVYSSCGGRLVAGQFITPKDVAEEPAHGVEGEVILRLRAKMTFQEAGKVFAARLQRETEMLDKLNQVR